MNSPKKPDNLFTKITRHFSQENWESEDYMSINERSKLVVGLQCATLAAITAIAGVSYYRAPSKEKKTNDLYNAMQESPDDYTDSEKRIIFERFLAETRGNDIQMNIGMQILALEAEEKIENKGRGYGVLNALTSKDKNYPPAHAVLGATKLQEIRKNVEADPSYVPSLQLLVDIEHNLASGSKTTKEQRNAVKDAQISDSFAEMVRVDLQSIRLKVIERLINIEDESNANVYIKRLLSETPEVAPMMLRTLHSNNVHSYDALIYETAMDNLKEIKEQDGTNPAVLKAISDLLSMSGQLKESVENYESINYTFRYETGQSILKKKRQIDIQSNYEDHLRNIAVGMQPKEILQTIVSSKILEQSTKSNLLREISAQIFPKKLEAVWEILCSTHIERNDRTTTDKRLQNVLERQPELIKEALIVLDAFGISEYSEGIMKLTLTELNKERKANPTNMDLYLYEVELLIAQNKWEEAHTLLETTLLYNNIKFTNQNEANAFKESIRASALKFFGSLLAASDKKQAEEIIRTSRLINENEKTFFTATLQIKHGQPGFDELIQLYREVSNSTNEEEFIDKAMVGSTLNNIAWNMFSLLRENTNGEVKRKKLTEAQGVANKALEFLPNHPAILDTLLQINTALENN